MLVEQIEVPLCPMRLSPDYSLDLAPRVFFRALFVGNELGAKVFSVFQREALVRLNFDYSGKTVKLSA